MKINLDFINKVFNLEIKITNQKDKDKLLKIQPTDFKTKKNTKVFVESIKDSNKKVFSVKEVLETDAILDKIFKSGMNSLTMNEKKFLDDLSKS